MSGNTNRLLPVEDKNEKQLQDSALLRCPKCHMIIDYNGYDGKCNYCKEMI